MTKETFKARNSIDTKQERRIWFTHLEGPQDPAARSALSYLHEIDRLREAFDKVHGQRNMYVELLSSAEKEIDELKRALEVSA